MAEEFDDCEYWLPPQFLTEDDLLMDFKKNTVMGKDNGCNGTRDFRVPVELGYGVYGHGLRPVLGSNSDLTSPIESVTETESDEDDFITGLTRKLAQSTLHDYEKNKGWRLSVSPQSTLCGVLGGGCGCNQSSSSGSPNLPSRVSSPPTPDMGRATDDGAWDLLYAAAGEVARMKLMEEAASAAYHNNNGVWAPPRRPSPTHKPSNPQNLGLMNSNSQLSTYQQLQLAHFQRLKQLQMAKNQQYQAVNQSRIGNNGGGVVGFRPAVNTSAWPTLQQSKQQLPGSGMRAVFLGNPAGGAKRECSGTGVFIPRRTGTPSESRKKPVCSTVLLPDRVVQALNLNMAAMEAESHQPQVLQPRFTANGGFDGSGVRNHRSNGVVMANLKHNQRPSPPAMASHELRLPQEWTY